jgi:hypothetical protein
MMINDNFNRSWAIDNMFAKLDLDGGYQVEFTRDANGELTLTSPSNKRPIVNPNDIGESKTPKNNDGRDTCYWCQAPTRILDTGMGGNMKVCTKCGK